MELLVQVVSSKRITCIWQRKARKRINLGWSMIHTKTEKWNIQQRKLENYENQNFVLWDKIKIDFYIDFLN